MIGNKLIELRAQHSYTQKELADMAQIPQSLLWKYEHDEAIPSVINAAKLARILGVTIEELIEKE